MNNYKTSVNPNPFSIFTIWQYLYMDFSNFRPFPNFSIITNHCIYNDQNNDLWHEARSLDLVSTKSFGSGNNPLFEVWTMY